MRRPYVALAALLLAAPIAGVIPGTDRIASAEVEVSIGVFHDSLSPYGEWVYVPHVGRVWRPDPGVVGDDFRPYATGGHWVDTDYGWSFESDYEWGWAPFHYGRWFHQPSYGWVWAPDTTWGPAWVDWRFGGGYVGWAPLPPRVVSVYYRGDPQWYFVDAPHFTDRRVWVHAVPRERAREAWTVTVPSRRPITHQGARWYAGPQPERVAQVQGRPVERMHVEPPRRGQVVRVQAERPTQPQQPTRVVPAERPDTRVAPAQRPGVQPQQPTRVVPAQRPDGAHVQQPPQGVPAGRRDVPPAAQRQPPQVVPTQRPDGPRAQPQPPPAQPQQAPRVVPSNRPAPAPTHAAPPPPRPQAQPQQQQQQAPRPAAPPQRPQPQPQQQAPRPAPPPQHHDGGKVHDERH